MEGNGYSNDVYARPPPYNPEFIEHVRQTDDELTHNEDHPTTVQQPSTDANNYDGVPSAPPPPPPPYNPAFLKSVSYDDVEHPYSPSARTAETLLDDVEEQEGGEYRYEQHRQHPNKWRVLLFKCRRVTVSGFHKLCRLERKHQVREKTKKAVETSYRSTKKAIRDMERGFHNLERKLEKRLDSRRRELSLEI
uniref:Uncharacterized protein n=1 Tax=Cyclophora tenuis TaxID=216820 RepID=A0A6U1PAA3_CYCTE